MPRIMPKKMGVGHVGVHESDAVRSTRCQGACLRVWILAELGGGDRHPLMHLLAHSARGGERSQDRGNGNTAELRHISNPHHTLCPTSAHSTTPPVVELPIERRSHRHPATGKSSIAPLDRGYPLATPAERYSGSGAGDVQRHPAPVMRNLPQPSALRRTPPLPPQASSARISPGPYNEPSCCRFRSRQQGERPEGQW